MKTAWLYIALVLLLAGRAVSAAAEKEIVTVSADELKKLDTFEGHTLAKADQEFSKEHYRQARAEYDSFILEFPRSKVIPYALFRKGRCAQLDDKRFKAIADYNEVLDYFPNEVKYASAALYYIGNCHWLNGDVPKAMKAWAEIADDEDYRKVVLAADAINSLADNLLKVGKAAEAVEYFEQVAVDFRVSNQTASEHARKPVIEYYIRTAPDETKFRNFYRNMKALEREPKLVPEDLGEDAAYWNELRRQIHAHGEFESLQKDLRQKYYAYWSGRLAGKFPENDDHQIDVANFRYLADGDRVKWFAALDKQYTAHQKKHDWQRTLKWMKVYSKLPAKIQQYYQKIDIAKTDNAGLIQIMQFFWAEPGTRQLAKDLVGKLRFEEMTYVEIGSMAVEFYEKTQVLAKYFLGKIDFNKMEGTKAGALAVELWKLDHPLGNLVVRKVNFEKMSDDEIAGLARSFWHPHNAQEEGEFVAGQIREDNFRKWTLVARYHQIRNVGEGLPLATDLTKVAKYADQAWWMRGSFLEWSGKYAEAIAAYKMCQNQPENLKRIAYCLEKLGKLEAAVTQLQEIENFFKPHASWAALAIANTYHRAGEKKKYIAALRGVLKKYPGSNESNSAHLALEQMGIKMGGGIDAT